MRKRLVVGTVAAALVLSACDNGKGALQAQVNALQSENVSLKAENTKLRSENATLKTERDTAQREAQALREQAAQANAPATSTASELPSAGYRYEVYASCPTNVTYSTSQGIQQESAVESPWVQDAAGVDLPQVSAQLTCEAGDVTAEIYRGETLYKTVSSKGDYAIAHAH